jgi:hypothetical protein
VSEEVCPQCGKVPYSSRTAASRVARKMGNRTYWSDICRAWHTTSGSWDRPYKKRKRGQRRRQKW